MFEHLIPSRSLILLCAALPISASAVVHLFDNFDDGSLDPSKWTAITATGSGSGYSAVAGNSVTESGGSLNLTQGTTDAGGAYQTVNMSVNDSELIVIGRRTKVSFANQYTSMSEQLVSNTGAGLLQWGYYNYNYSTTQRFGFGGFYDTLTTGIWDQWFDETITYDPATGFGTYTLNDHTPITITGTPLPVDASSVFLRGGAYGWFTGHTKQFDSFSVSQSVPEPSTFALLIGLLVGASTWTRRQRT